MSDRPKRYRAFISYSQNDKAFARRLHRALETYQLPRGAEVAGVDRKTRKLGRLFRDDDEMGAATDLGAALQGAIADAENLIVICSPNAAKSRWVNEEVIHFKRTGRADRVFAVIVSGEPTPAAADRECFPPALRFELGPDGALTDKPAEPLGVDVRKEPFKRLITRLAAGLVGTPFDALWKREQRRARARALAISLTLALTTVTLAATATQNSWRPMLDAYMRYARFAHSSAQLSDVRPGARFQDCRSHSSDCPVMVVIPEGHLLTGSSVDESEPSPRTIAMPRFAVSSHEITFANWQACVDGGGCSRYVPDSNGWESDGRPVINVSWNDAQGYVEWLSNVTRVRYRLLNDAEWEYAARSSVASDTPALYSWGDDPPVCDVQARNGAPVGDHCIEGAEAGLSAYIASLFSDAANDPEHRPFRVGSFRPNAFGLHDMHGNVWEWVDGCPRYDANNACRVRVMRGGGRGSIPSEDVTSSSRQMVRDGDHYRANNVGFRIARSL